MILPEGAVGIFKVTGTLVVVGSILFFVITEVSGDDTEVSGDDGSTLSEPQAARPTTPRTAVVASAPSLREIRCGCVSDMVRT